MTNREIIANTRFRRAVLAGAYSRAISTFLRIKFPEVENLSTLPREELQNAQVCVDNAFFDKEETAKEMAEEMR